jgi:hypothetical protein
MNAAFPWGDALGQWVVAWSMSTRSVGAPVRRSSRDNIERALSSAPSDAVRTLLQRRLHT